MKLIVFFLRSGFLRCFILEGFRRGRIGEYGGACSSCYLGGHYDSCRLHNRLGWSKAFHLQIGAVAMT
jgi:hypothetical protein